MPDFPSSTIGNPFENKGLIYYPGMLSDTDGTPYGVKHVGNKPRVSAMPYTYDIAEGNIPDHTAVRVFGHNADVTTAWETVHHGSDLKYYLSDGAQLSVASADSDDTLLGSGAQTLTIVGLDSDYVALSETVDLAGLTDATTTASFLRVNSAYVATAGTDGYNAGEISIADDGDSDIIVTAMEAGHNNILSAHYTVPAGTTLYVVQATATDGSLKGCQFGFWVRVFGSVWRMMRTVLLLDDNIVLPAMMPMKLPQKTDLEIRGNAVAAGANVTAGFEGWIE